MPAHAAGDAHSGEAVELGEAGLRALEAQKFTAAIELFEEAERLVHSPVFQLLLAEALEKANRWLEASAVYRKLVSEQAASAEPAQWTRARATAVAKLAALTAQVPYVLIHSRRGASETALWDGLPVPTNSRFAVDPGEHQLNIVDHEGHSRTEQVIVAPGGLWTLVVTFPSAAATSTPKANAATSAEVSGARQKAGTPEPASSNSFASTTATYLGLVSVGFAIAAGIVAIEEHAVLEKACPGKLCGPEATVHYSTGRRWAQLSTAGFVVGGVTLATAGILFWVAPRGSDGSATPNSPWIGISGQF